MEEKKLKESPVRDIEPVTMYGYNSPKELEETKPEKENLTFDESKISKDMRDAMQPILDLSKKHLWHWKTFPIMLPQTTTMVNDTNSASGSKKKTINMKDLFIAPKFNELETLATTSEGRPKKLSHEQIVSIQETGEFSIDSVQFPGQKHTWRLSNVLQKGSKRSTETMQRNLSTAAELIVVHAKDRLIGGEMSLQHNFVSGWKEGLVNLVDILVGVPHLEPENVEEKLQEERVKFLVCELNIKEKENIEEIVTFLKLKEAKDVDKQNKMPKLPYVFSSLKNGEINLRLQNPELISSINPSLTRILTAESEGWFPEFRDNHVFELKEKSLANKDIEKQVNNLVMEEYLERVCKAIKSDTAINQLGEGVVELLIDHLKAGVIFDEALQSVEDYIQDELQNENEKLKMKNPICSKVKSWVKKKLSEKEYSLRLENQLTAHGKALDVCQTKGLAQHAYFLSRDILFLKSQEPILRKELNDNMKKPANRFNFKTRVWSPQSWKVSQLIKIDSKVIPTVVNNKMENFEQLDGHNETRFIVEKNNVSTVSTGKAFWRWKNFFHYVWSSTWNFMFWLGIVLPFCSSVSFRSLFCLDEFYPNYILSQRNGELYKDPHSKTETLASRLKILWRHIAKKREEFEATPDRGLLGKTVTRHLNRFVNYFLKGFFGTLLICLCFPVCCLVIPSVSIILALLAPLVIPPILLLCLLLSAIFADYHYSATALIPNLLWNIGGHGITLPLGNLIFVFVFVPICSLFIVVFALLRKFLRQLWDSFLFHLIIKKRARVPAFNSFIVRRIKGPGMASDYFYQVKTEQVLVALEAQMEIEELEAFKAQFTNIIKSPLDDYHKFISNTMRPLSLSVHKGNGGPYERVSTETSDLLGSLNKKVDFRINQLKINLTKNMKERIKLSERELKLALSRGAAMTFKFYPEHVIARTKGGEIQFWESRGLKSNDWVGLTSSLYSSIFSEEFLTPMQEEDTTFQLKIDHWNMSRYLNMVIESDWHDDLDISRAVRSPKQNINISPPAIKIPSFNPSASPPDKKSVEDWYWDRFRWSVAEMPAHLKPRPASHLTVLLPVPHPAEVILIIHNRDSEVQIGLEHIQTIKNCLSSEYSDSQDVPKKDKVYVNADRNKNDDEMEPLKKPELKYIV